MAEQPDPLLLPNKSGEWSLTVVEKAEKMERKTTEVRNMFNLPAMETVVQDYYCSLEQTINHGGRMWITLNYVCFYSGVPFYITEYFPFRMVEEIKQNVGVFFDNSIDFILKDGRVFHFHSFFNVKEVLNVLIHIWKFPPSYLQLDAEDEEDEIGVSREGRNESIFGSFSSSSSSLNPFASSEDGKKSLYVNVTGSERALDLAEQSRDKGIEILNELDAQGERLDRMETSIDNINQNLDRGDRHIRGIGSASGAALNLVTRDKTKKNAKVIAREHRAKDKWGELMSQGIELEILLKLQSDDLVEAVLCFQRDKISVKDAASQRTIAQCIWNYSDFKFIILRARPLHIDFRFWDNRPRFRMMTSHVQAIANELFLRCSDAAKKKQFFEGGGGGEKGKGKEGGVGVRVLFEPNARPFDFGSYFLTLEVVSGEKEGEDGKRKVVARKNAGMASLLGEEIDDETKRNVRKAESNFDQIYDRAVDLEKIGEVMEGTLEDQTEQAERISEKTARANDRMKNQNDKVRAITRDLS